MKLTFLFKLVIFCGCSVAFNTYADWKFVTNSEDNNKIFVDEKSIIKNGNRLKVLQKLELNSPLIIVPNQPSTAALSAQLFTEYDCSEGKERLLAFSFFSKNQLQGNIVSSSTDAEPWEQVKPQSVQSSIFNVVCKTYWDNRLAPYRAAEQQRQWDRINAEMFRSIQPLLNQSNSLSCWSMDLGGIMHTQCNNPIGLRCTSLDLGGIIHTKCQ